MKEGGYIQENPEQPLEVLRILAEGCVRTQLDKALTSMNLALQALASHNPEWLRRFSLSHWYRRYDTKGWQPDLTQSMEKQQALLDEIGADVTYLLDAINQAAIPELSSLNDIQELRQLWRELFNPHGKEPAKAFPNCNSCGALQ
jgi:hypothetical protein